MPQTILASFVPLGIFLGALFLGEKTLAAFHFPKQDSTDYFLWKTLLGLGVLGMCLFALGLAGLFRPGVLWALLFGTACSGVPMGLRQFKKCVRLVKYPRDFFTASLGIVAVLMLFLIFLNLRVPSTAADELSYHLYLPKLFLLKGEIDYSPYHVNSLFPLLTEMLYSFGVMLESPFATKSIHFLFGLLFSLGTYSLARIFFSRELARAAAILCLTLPIVNHQMGLASNDLALSAFSVGSYLALFRWLAERKNIWLILAGILSGFAMEVKYLALLAIGIQVVVILREILTRKEDLGIRRMGAFASFCVPLVLISLSPYLRAFYHTGNPFYPYLTHLFGGTGLENPLQLESKGFGKGLLALMTLPWNATFQPEAFGGLGNQWGPIFLGFLPGIFLIRKKARLWQTALWFSGLGLLLWFFTKQNLRFLLPMAPFLCLVVTGVLDHWEKAGRESFRMAKGLFLCFMGLHLGIALYQLRNDYAVAMGLESKDRYLESREPSYLIAKFLNERSGKKTKVLSQEHRAYYFDGELVRERAYRRLTHYDKIYEKNKQKFLEQLSREGYTHVLLLQQNGLPAATFWNEILIPGKKNAVSLALLQKHEFVDRTLGEKRTYLLYEIPQNMKK